MVHGLLLASAPAVEVRDLVQDVFTRAWASLPTLREPSAFSPWLASIARRRAADLFRRPRPVESPPEEPPLAATESPTYAESLTVLEAIRSLPDAYREMLILRLVEGMTGPEIASQTGRTHASVRVNLHRGMKLLRKRLDHERTNP